MALLIQPNISSIKKQRRLIPPKFEDHYESALTELINEKRSRKPITAKARPKGENVVDLMEALKRSIGNEAQATKGKKPRKAAAGQKEMLLPISGKRAANKTLRKQTSPQRREAGSVHDRSLECAAIHYRNKACPPHSHETKVFFSINYLLFL